jgi:uncharacterized protein
VSVVYVETSALLAWMFRQEGEEAFAAAVDHADSVVTSDLTFAEAGRAVTRAEAATTLDAVKAGSLRARLDRFRRAWSALAIDEAVLDRVAGAYPVEPVRTLDAIHLASALVWAREHPELRVLTQDRRLRENASALGLG